MGARRAREGAAVTQQRLSAFRFPFSSLRGKRAFTPVFNGLWRRSNPGSAAQSLDCFVANAPRNDEVYPRVIVMASDSTVDAV
jgi:hypothetical protein